MPIPSRTQCFVVGTRIDGYARTAALVRALERAYDVKRFELAQTDVRTQWRLMREISKEAHSNALLILLYPIERIIWSLLFAKLRFPGVVVADLFISSYGSWVQDRALASPYGLKALYYSMRDALPAYFADRAIFDTHLHEAYFRSRYFFHKRTITHIFPISLPLADIDNLPPASIEGVPAKGGKFRVLFFGNYIPLQGVEYILRAFAQLSNREAYQLVMIGAGQTYREARTLAHTLALADVIFIERTPQAQLLAFAKEADLALGIFGHTDKATRVIPNKLLEAMACGVPVVTGANEACTEYFAHERECYYVPLADPEALARAIECIALDEGRFAVAKRAREVIEREFSLERLTERVRELSPAK